MIQQALQATEARTLADREAAAPGAGRFEGGSPALTALLIVVCFSSLLSIFAFFYSEEFRPDLGS